MMKDGGWQMEDGGRTVRAVRSRAVQDATGERLISKVA